MVSEMHEILFKGQRKDNKKWIEGYLYQNLVKAFIILPHTGALKMVFSWERKIQSLMPM